MRSTSHEAGLATTGTSSHVQSVTRALDLLEAVAIAGTRDTSVAALAYRCGLNRATAWRLLSTLESRGMVVRDPRTGRFRLGPAVDRLVSRRGHQDVLERAHPVLERLSLETGEIACLGVVLGDQVHYVGEVIPPIVHEASWVGVPVVLHASSMGKALLASMDVEHARELLGGHLPRYTDATITDFESFAVDLQQTRARGYAICRGEHTPGSWGVAAPVISADGRMEAVLGLWGPDNRGGQQRLAALGRVARRAATELAEASGGFAAALS